ncbi:Pleiotropic drug resistance protein 3 [Camellia lanceoleosa]|uniref:Pleiotropic drug resistance protein 3 n=1 Tax=Camellia lanceoleosa TaxID=1840588 RepID=A0ACC0F3T3_9ERIC|nr:Pleiotropic drug resistance protein 3 [Camellia lanceoleosa]
MNSTPGSRAITSNEKLSQIQGSKDSFSAANAEAKSIDSPNYTTKSHKRSRVVLPFEPPTLVFRNVQYYVDIPVEFVKEVLEIIELDEIKDCLVGMPSVTEQRKWLTISVELVANPSIIFMDEPTTRLDARAAAIIMRAVKNVAETGRILVLSMTWISSILLLFQILTWEP